MMVFQYYLRDHAFKSLLEFDFVLIMVSTLLVAAAGNIINDYFDVKADRVNKPESLIIDKYIKRRWAIVFNWIFNIIAFLLSGYVSWKLKSFPIVLISFGTIVLLWFYSMYFKRTFILGNILVAALTALVPLYVLAYDSASSIFDHKGQVTLVFAGFAFLLNFIREIIKDMADVKGDLLLNSQSMPIKFGMKNTRLFLSFVYFIVFSSLAFVLFYTKDKWMNLFAKELNISVGIVMVGLIYISMIISLFFLPIYPNRKKYLIASNLLKLAMFFGLLIPIFL